MLQFDGRADAGKPVVYGKEHPRSLLRRLRQAGDAEGTLKEEDLLKTGVA